MKIVQYKKIAMFLLLSSLSLHVYAMDDDGSGIGNGDEAPSELSNKEPQKKEAESSNKREPIAPPARLTPLITIKDLKNMVREDSHDLREMAQFINWKSIGLPPMTDKQKVLMLQQLVQKESERDLTGLVEHINDRRERNAELEESIKHYGNAPDEQLPSLAVNDIGAKFKELSETCNSLPSVVDPEDEVLAKRIEALKLSPMGLEASQARLVRTQALALERKMERENEGIWQHLNRADVKIGLAVTFGAPVFDLLVKRYGNGILGAIEQMLGFGPSEQEQAMAMHQMMNHMEFQNRRNRAEVQKKELEVSILRAVQRRQDLEAEKEELQLEMVKKKIDLLDQIAELTAEKLDSIAQGVKFLPSKEKKLNELKTCLQAGQMIDKELQDLKRASNPGVAIPGMA